MEKMRMPTAFTRIPAVMALAIGMPGLTSGAAAQAAAPASAQPTARPQANPGYILGPNDEVEVRIFGQPDMTVKTRIKADGTVNLALLGPFQARGKNTSQLSAEIAAAYEAQGYLVNPSVNVEVTSFISKTVTVLGDVPNSGNYPLDRPYSVASMIALAGGVKATGANAVILTPADGSAPVRISLNDLSGAAMRPLQPGDVLFVPPAERVYVYGQVNEPGAYKYQPGMTYRQAMAEAGGPTLAASSGIDVRRDGKKVEGLKLDDELKPEDVLVIKEKLF
jgi:polysaccharide export outer membrane protein